MNSLRTITQRTYRLRQDSLHDKFDRSRAKIQLFAGGFANGKTAAVVVLKALKVAKDYPGANVLMARATYPKLNDTLRKEFLKWCPKDWIESFPMSATASNTCTLKNGTTINFRYVAQQGRNEEASTSNLLSATYDLIVIDQIEDPEIMEKDFDDLLGRLRGMTPYIGTDETMPETGPRWLVLTCNPTRNWVYRKLVRPLHLYQQMQLKTKELLVDVDTGEPIVDLFEGSTYENQENLEKDFIKTLEATYRGPMRERFLMGQWAAYEGLVYPMWDDTQHVVPHERIVSYFHRLNREQYEVTVVEGYDYGLAVHACYLLGFVDPYGNVLIFDGFYEKEMSIEAQETLILETRARYGIRRLTQPIFADPSIFKRHTGDKRTVGRRIVDLFDKLQMQRGNNDKMNGIVKVSSYLHLQQFHVSPLSGTGPAPYLYISDNIEWFSAEIIDYYWKRDMKTNEPMDEPMNRRDHAMDTIKYILSRRPDLSRLLPGAMKKTPAWMMWGEREAQSKGEIKARHRHMH